jgi:hypothetical protein
MPDTRTEHTPEVVEAEPDMSWFDIAVDHSHEVFVLGHSSGWTDYDIEHFWEDVFEHDAPSHLAPGAYRWTGFKIGFWGEGEHLNVSGGEFNPLPASLPAASEGEKVDEARSVLERALVGSPKYLRARVNTAISLLTRAGQIGGEA